MKHLEDDCVRLEQLLARMDDASGAPAHRTDPTDALTPDELAWAGAHVDACPRCAPGAAADVALLADALRDDVDIPDDAFFATRRDAILAAIRSAETPTAASARPAARLVASRAPGRSNDRALRASPVRRERRRARRVVLTAALAAGLVVALASGLLRSAGEVAEPTRDGAPAAEQVATLAIDPAELAVADDAWLVASNDLFVAALASTGDDSLGALSDEELDEIADVFLPAPGWS